MRYRPWPKGQDSGQKPLKWASFHVWLNLLIFPWQVLASETNNPPEGLCIRSNQWIPWDSLRAERREGLMNNSSGPVTRTAGAQMDRRGFGFHFYTSDIYSINVYSLSCWNEWGNIRSLLFGAWDVIDQINLATETILYKDLLCFQQSISFGTLGWILADRTSPYT